MMATETSEDIPTSQESTAQSSKIIRAMDSHNFAAEFGLRLENGPNTSAERDPNEQSITYQFLTFETPILELQLTALRDKGSEPIPAFPDLSQYESPFLWRSTRKTATLVLCCAATLCSAYSAGAYFLPSAALEKKWDLSTVAFNTGVTTWAVGFALSPMILAPF